MSAATWVAIALAAAGVAIALAALERAAGRRPPDGARASREWWDTPYAGTDPPEDPPVGRGSP